MKTIKLTDLRKQNAERREIGLAAARRVDPEFYPGKRTYDKPRKEGKAEIIKLMQEEEIRRIKNKGGK